jgi:hypothetical protein
MYSYSGPSSGKGIIYCLIIMLCVRWVILLFSSGSGIVLWMQNLRPSPRSSFDPTGSLDLSRLWKARFCGC